MNLTVFFFLSVQCTATVMMPEHKKENSWGNPGENSENLNTFPGIMQIICEQENV